MKSDTPQIVLSRYHPRGWEGEAGTRKLISARRRLAVFLFDRLLISSFSRTQNHEENNDESIMPFQFNL